MMSFQVHFSLLSLFLIACLAGACEEKLTFDTQGVAHGSGEHVYYYKSGEIKLRETYVKGELVHSRWFRPDGTLIQETRWVNGNGEGIYLREDGSIRIRMNHVNGLAEGEAIHYDEQGNVAKVELFEAGSPVGDAGPAAPHRVARQTPNPAVPADARLETFIGDWLPEGEDVLALSIIRDPDGTGRIVLTGSSEWDAIVNNVRFEADTLRYNEFWYYTGDEDFSPVTVGDHPYSGVRNQVTLSAGPEPGTLVQIVTTKDVPEGIQGVLRRRE